MRNRYFVAYDVMDPARLARTYKKMLGYGDRVQYSVFICSLSAQGTGHDEGRAGRDTQLEGGPGHNN